MKHNRVQQIIDSLPLAEADLLIEHIFGDTSANWLSETLTAHGHPVSATTLKDYRAMRRAEYAG